MVGRQASIVQRTEDDGQVGIAGGVVVVHIAVVGRVPIVALGPGEGEARTEVPSCVHLPCFEFAEGVARHQVHVVAAVPHRVVRACAIPPVHIRVAVHRPEVVVVLLVLQQKVRTVRFAALDDVVLLQFIRLVGELLGVVEQFVAVQVGHLAEVLQVHLEVGREFVGDVVLEPSHIMVGALQWVLHLANVAVRFDEVPGQVVRRGQEAIEQVHHVAVAVGGHQVLTVAPARCFEAQVVRDVPLEAQAWFRTGYR